MPRTKPPIQDHQAPKHSTACSRLPMCTHQHAFTPILHPSLTIQPAPTVTQDSNFNMHLPRAATRPSFAPVSAFHRATQKPFRSTKRGRWGSLHVSIAWKIYYHEQLKKMHQKPNSLHRELTPEYLSTCQPDTVQQKDSDQPSCIHPNIDSPCGRSTCVNTGDRSETGENLSHFKKSYFSDLYTSSAPSCHSHATKREKQDQLPNLHWREKLDEKEKHRGQQVETTQELPCRDKSWDRRTTPEPDGRRGASADRKRQLESDSSIRVKRVKQDIGDDTSKTLHADLSLFSTTHTHPSSHTMPAQHRSDLSVMYPNSRCNVTRTPGTLISYPGAEMHPYQTASWEPVWDVHSRQHVLQDYTLNTCKAMRIPVAAQRQKEAFHGFFTPPLYLPFALRQQHHHHPGYLAKSYMGL